MTATSHHTADEINETPETAFVHPLNADAVRHTRTLSTLAGLKNLGVHLVRVEPGHQTTEYHVHHMEEEFLYVLSGRGVATIDGIESVVGPGDFLGFAAGGPLHVMRNDGPEDLVYLMAGERRASDVVDYPRVGKRLLKQDGGREYVDLPEEKSAK
ncbi:MAG: cupin domain-containing protein [Rhodospirillales bacterium]|nr:cupin domain-containing protein [Rhodospirillales bacterium]